MTKDLDASSLDFGGLLTDAAKGLKVKPVLRNYLHAGNFPDFSVHFEKGDGRRAPDGWFHPSQHPTVAPRGLYHYLMHPGELIVEPMPYMNVLSVTMGKAVHGFVEFCLTEAKYLAPRLDACSCGNPACTEWGFEDRECGEHGHTDGVAVEGEIFELKSVTEMSSKIRKAQDMDLDFFRHSYPRYWAQQQSYLRMSGRAESRVLFFTLGFPWEMKEFVVPFDPLFAHQVSTKYRAVRQAVADQRRPDECCAVKNCPAYSLCMR